MISAQCALAPSRVPTIPINVCSCALHFAISNSSPMQIATNANRKWLKLSCHNNIGICVNRATRYTLLSPAIVDISSASNTIIVSRLHFAHFYYNKFSLHSMTFNMFYEIVERITYIHRAVHSGRLSRKYNIFLIFFFFSNKFRLTIL